jgi:hypothetical protein
MIRQAVNKRNDCIRNRRNPSLTARVVESGAWDIFGGFITQDANQGGPSQSYTCRPIRRCPVGVTMTNEPPSASATSTAAAPAVVTPIKNNPQHKQKHDNEDDDNGSKSHPVDPDTALWGQDPDQDEWQVVQKKEDGYIGSMPF